MSLGGNTRKQQQVKAAVPRFRMSSAEKRKIARLKAMPVDHEKISSFIVELGKNIKSSEEGKTERKQIPLFKEVP